MPNLAELKYGQTAVIKEFKGVAPNIKLLEMGCLPGNTVELVQIAPFKDPLYFNFNGAHIAIRKSVAQHIEIDLL